MRRARIRGGLRRGSPLWPTPTTSPLTPFFWSRNVREANVAVRMSASGAVARLRRVPPQKSWTLRSWKGVDSDGLYAYSPGRRRKKNARPIILARHWCWGSSWRVKAIANMRLMTDTGTGLTRFGGGSMMMNKLLVYAMHILMCSSNCVCFTCINTMRIRHTCVPKEAKNDLTTF